MGHVRTGLKNLTGHERTVRITNNFYAEKNTYGYFGGRHISYPPVKRDADFKIYGCGCGLLRTFMCRNDNGLFLVKTSRMSKRHKRKSV